MDKVNIGVIGLGMGAHHARYLSKGEVPGAELTAVCDVKPERLQWARENCGEKVKLFESPEALFASKAANTVLIATPHYFHPPLALQAFKNGCNVIIEKPAGVYTKHVREMNECAKKSGKLFGIMFNARTVPCNQKLKDLVASGELGEIRRTLCVATDWFRSQAYYDSGSWRATWAGEGGGILLNQCPHTLDLWQWITGMPKRVRAFCAFGKHHKIEVEDDVTAYVEYPNGSTGVFIASTGDAPGTNCFDITGDRGRALLQGGKLTFWRTRVSVREYTFTTQEGFTAPEHWVCEIPAPPAGGQHQELVKDFVRAIQQGTKLLARGEEGVNSLELANAMLLSTWMDNWIDLPISDELYYSKLQEQIKNSKVSKAGGGKALDFKSSFHP